MNIIDLYKENKKKFFSMLHDTKISIYFLYGKATPKRKINGLLLCLLLLFAPLFIQNKFVIRLPEY